MITTLRTIAVAHLSCALLSLGIGGRALAQKTIPIHALAPVNATASTTFRALSGIKHLPGGRLLANDTFGHRLLVFDSTLTRFTILADSADSQTHYGRTGSPLIPYIGDSTLFVDYDSRSLILIEPTGKLGRIMSGPSARDGVNMPGARADARGRLVYRTVSPRPMVRMPDGGMRAAPAPDSAAIVRADFDTRVVDTIARVRIVLAAPPENSVDANGKRTYRRTVNLVPPAIDEWTVLSDGSTASVRGLDYHVDWIYADGTRASTPKMPFDWRRLTDADKQAKIDSAQKILDSLTAIGKNPNIVISMGAVSVNMTTGERTSSAQKPETSYVHIDYASLDDMGSYVAPLRTGSVYADADGNLWILPTTSLQAKGGLLYDVVNKKGEVFERVQLPPDRDIAGFGPNGIVYLSKRENTTPGPTFTIERTRIVR